MNRRSFLKMSLAGSTAPLILPSRLLGEEAPSRTLNLACIGIGGHGRTIAHGIGRHRRVRVVALCDVDLKKNDVHQTCQDFPDAKVFEDFRVMFDEMGDDIDAVTVGTPDHSHFPIAMHAIKLGIHVYVEKPMANTFQECELLMQAARKHGVVTQMGNQGFSGRNYEQHKLYAESGFFDGVHTIISYMNGDRRWHGWNDITGFPEGQDIPREMNWDFWHTTAEERPFSWRFHPGNWRSWYRYGGGAIGDWAPHILDTAHLFLNLGLPSKVELTHVKQHNAYIFPLESTIHYVFPERNGRRPIDVYWYDGQRNRPPTPEEAVTADDRDRGFGREGRFLIGGKFTFHGGSHDRPLIVVPEARRREVHRDLPRYGGGKSHYGSFVMASLGEDTTRSNFDVAAPLTQACCLGTIAQELNTSLDFDPEAKRFTNNELANELLKGPPPRKGWEQYYTV